MPVSTFLLLLLLTLSAVSSEPPPSERAALLSFLSQVPHLGRLQWSPNSSTCSWHGVTCDQTRSAAVELHLPAAGLVGPIPANTLGLLSNLRVLSLRRNAIADPIPDDLSNLTRLRSLYLQDNAIAGGFPTTLTRLTRLSRLNLAGNDLSGEIPFSVNNLTRLRVLYLERNGFSGKLPSINLTSLNSFNVSFNKLNGSIPETLARFPASSFAGNLDLCGDPLPPCFPFFPSPSPSAPPAIPSKKHTRRLSTGAIIAIVVGIVVFLILLSLLLFFCCCKKRRGRTRSKPAHPPAASAAAAAAAAAARDVEMTPSSKDEMSEIVSLEKNRLTFVSGGGGYSFDLEDLLRASAEVLGKGRMGTSYKAILEEGTTTVVVKRLKDVAVSKWEFEMQIEEIGRIEHRNLLPVRAYYYSKDEKLLVFDFVAAGSLSSLLHGSRGSGRTPLNWDNRLRIALAAGRGLAHLHNAARIIHGNIKSSNILLRSDPESAVLSDFALYPLLSNAAPPNRVAGYRAPEVMETRKPTFKSDVYSFGVVMLELLTGKVPNQASLGEEGIDLPRWVQSVVREEWTAEVFDVELMRYRNIEEEMVQLLQVAMACVATMPDSRPEVGEVMRMMEEIANRGAEGDDGIRGSSDDLPSMPAAATP